MEILCKILEKESDGDPTQDPGYLEKESDGDPTQDSGEGEQ